MNESLDSHLVHGRRQRPTGASPVDIISVQSQLVYGYAGNSAAVPPLHRLDMRVAVIPTTLLSNTPFYETLRGKMLPTDLFGDLLRGASERGLPQRARALISGYFGSLGNGQAFADWVEATLPDAPGMRFFLDPVIGDTHTGPYVEAGLDKVISERLLPHAWLVTPNAFELEQLTGMPALQEADAVAASRKLLARGPEWVIAHSIVGEPGQLVSLAVGHDVVHRWVSPYLAVDVAGTGDVLVALTTAFLLRGESLPQAVTRALAGVHAALESTLENGIEELDVQVAATAALRDKGRFPYITTNA
ncbi:MAG: pyridoxal kinase [Xanthomonadaceae bacterium]|jgi:pyridoxine kinase|nr:pyridoxal kinase [Xanthomonadaceae bacterium]